MRNSLQDWQQALAQAITDPHELCRELALDSEACRDLIRPTQFPLRVPRGFVARMEKGNPRDPLLLQVLPLANETDLLPNFSKDPLQEKQANPIPGLLHKYHGRVLLITTGACAVHCRYCFRRFFPYEDNARGTQEWRPALDYIAADPSIEEVILSGGDPLIVKDSALAGLMEKLAAIDHVKTLRVHTRLPIVLPERITSSLIGHLTSTHLKPVIVIHCNHPNEIDDTVIQALFALRQSGVILLNQSVLLKNINDRADILIHLSKKLFSAGVLPYYLHLLDPVQGSAHFAVSAEQGLQLIRAITAQLPGYLVPKLVQEIAGESAKVSL